MQNIMVFRKMLPILLIALVSFGCATNRDSTVNYEIGMTTEAKQEGILLSFTNIPTETTRILILIMDLDGYYNPDFNSRNYTAVAELTGNNLKNIKQTGKVLFPFVQAGHRYDITAYFYNYYVDDEGNLVNSDVRPGWVRSEITAINGIYFENDLELVVNESQRTVTLTSVPEFSSELYFGQPKFNFDLNILRVIAENDTAGFSIIDRNNNEGLRWYFENEAAATFQDEYYFMYYRELMDIQEYIVVYWWDEPITNEVIEFFNSFGVHQAIATVYCNIIYDGILWKVDIAKSPAFIFEL